MINSRKMMIQRSVFIMKVIEKLVARRNSLNRKKITARRSPPEVPRDPNPNYWLSPWGQLVTRLSSIEGGPSIESRGEALSAPIQSPL